MTAPGADDVVDFSHLWYHTIDLPDGRCTPGQFDTRAAPAEVPWPAEVADGRCLDVGTFDGFWAFELERRGAREVVAMDVDDPESLDWAFDHKVSGPAGVRARRSERGPGFVQAAAALGSMARRISCSVYDLSPEVEGEFDVVLCGALLPHLRDPVLALERIRSVCTGVLIAVEAIDAVLEVTSPRRPVAHVRPWHDQWWRVNSAGLSTLLDVTGFRVRVVGRRFIMPLGPGAPAGAKQSLLTGAVARRPGARGVLLRAFIAEPRPPHDQS